MTTNIKVTWNNEAPNLNPDLKLVGLIRGKNRAAYFDTMREADRFASQWLDGRTRFRMNSVEVN